MHGASPSVGFLATISPRPPDSFTAAEAIDTAALRFTDVKHKTTLLANRVVLGDRF